MQFDADTIAAVVEHMNQDHSDACLTIVQAYCEFSSVTSATLHTFDNVAMEFIVLTDDSTDSKTVKRRICFPKPLRQAGQIRGAIVGLTKSARQLLAKPEAKANPRSGS